MFTLKTFSIGLYQELIVFLSKSKGQKIVCWFTSLAKPPLQNQPSLELLAIVFCPKPFYSDQRSKIDQS
jgi:hypothetical protein